MENTVFHAFPFFAGTHGARVLGGREKRTYARHLRLFRLSFVMAYARRSTFTRFLRLIFHTDSTKRARWVRSVTDDDEGTAGLESPSRQSTTFRAHRASGPVFSFQDNRCRIARVTVKCHKNSAIQTGLNWSRDDCLSYARRSDVYLSRESRESSNEAARRV